MTYIPVYHHKSHIHGVGVFTPVDLKKGYIIGVSHARYDGFWYMTTHGYYNHSETPNCIIEMKDNQFSSYQINLIIAKVDIMKGEELTADYREQPSLEQPKEDWV
jgi:SET domain-containing protein